MTQRTRALSVATVAAVVAGLGVATPASANENELADLGVESTVIRSAGVERTVRHTVTNHGPHEAYAGDVVCLPDCVETGFYLQFTIKGAELLSTSIPCSDDPYNSGPNLDRQCAIGRSLAAGASKSVDVRVRVTRDGFENKGFFSGGVRGDLYYDGGMGYGRGASTDPNYDNQSEFFFWRAPPGCVVKATNPQRATLAGFKVRVVANTGCAAKLTSAKLTIGKKKYVFIRKRPQRTLAAGQTWRLALPYGAGTLSTIRKALAKGTKVSVSATFDIDGTTRNGKARLR